MLGLKDVNLNIEIKNSRKKLEGSIFVQKCRSLGLQTIAKALPFNNLVLDGNWDKINFVNW